MTNSGCDPAKQPLLYTQRQAADRLGISVPTFVKHARPHLRAVQVGTAARYSETELRRWVAEAERAPSSSSSSSS